jgi:sulfite reductase alpha subunit-like flavoprotein
MIVSMMKKCYVQDLILQNADHIFDMMFNKNGHFYICGDVKISNGVISALETILVNKMKMNSSSATDYIDQMKVNIENHL